MKHNKEQWRPMSILAEHDLHTERLSREWKESQASFVFVDQVQSHVMRWMKTIVRTVIKWLVTRQRLRRRRRWVKAVRVAD